MTSPVATLPQARALVARLFSAIDGQKLDDLAAVLHPEVVYERPGYEPLVGRERVLHFYRVERIIAQGRHEVAAVTHSKDHVICYGQFTGVSRDGQALSERFADVYRLEDGLIRHRTTFFYRAAI